jgi:hypothetical protein
MIRKDEEEQKTTLLSATKPWCVLKSEKIRTRETERKGINFDSNKGKCDGICSIDGGKCHEEGS